MIRAQTVLFISLMNTCTHMKKKLTGACAQQTSATHTRADRMCIDDGGLAGEGPINGQWLSATGRWR